MNSNEEINKKFHEIKKRTTKEPEPEERDDSEKTMGAGTAMFMGGEVIPSYEEMFAGEDSDNDGYILMYTF